GGKREGGVGGRESGGAGDQRVVRRAPALERRGAPHVPVQQDQAKGPAGFLRRPENRRDQERFLDERRLEAVAAQRSADPLLDLEAPVDDEQPKSAQLRGLLGRKRRSGGI